MIESPVSTEPVVDVTDVTSAQAVAVLSVPPHSSVLDIGRSQANVARALAARGCRVWAIDTDGSALASMAPWCEASLAGDVEQVDLSLLLGSQRVETVLLLVELDRLTDLGSALARLVPFLAPGGRIVLSISDEAGPLESVFQQAGVRVIDEARIGPTADDRQRVLVAVPGDHVSSDCLPGLAGTMAEHLHRVTDQCRRFEARSRELANEVVRSQSEHDRLRLALEEAREWHRRSAATASDVRGMLDQSELERRRLEHELAAVTHELERCQRERRFLRDDVMVKDAYLASLREAAAHHQDEVQRHEALHGLEAQRRQQLDDEVHSLSGRLEEQTAEHSSQRNRAEELERCNAQLRQQVAAAEQELHRVHSAIAATIAQPRYVAADRLNTWLKRTSFLHGPLKRSWLARRGR